MAKRKYKFTVIACRWFDRTYGNTYHSVQCTKHSTGETIYGEMEYGYGDCYRQTAIKLMFKAGWLPKTLKESNGDIVKLTGLNAAKNIYKYDRLAGYPILWSVSDGLKQDCVANGKEY